MRLGRSPFQFIVASGLATEIIDSRMARLPLISWSREQTDGTESPKFGAVEEFDMSTETCDDRGAVVAISSRPKVATLYPFERSQKRARQCPTLSLQLLRYNDEDGEQADMCGSQYVTSDAPLDLRLEDGGEYTHLMGICSLRDDAESSSARVYQLNNLGDLYSQRVAWSSGKKTKPYAAAVQPEYVDALHILLMAGLISNCFLLSSFECPACRVVSPFKTIPATITVSSESSRFQWTRSCRSSLPTPCRSLTQS